MSLVPTKDPTEVLLFGSLVTPRNATRAAKVAACVRPREARPVKKPVKLYFDPENQPRGMVGRMPEPKAPAPVKKPVRKPAPQKDSGGGKCLDGFEFMQFLTLLRIVADAQERAMGILAPPTMAEVAKKLCRKHGVTLALLRSHQRDTALCRVRFEGMYLMRVQCAVSLSQIGKFFDRDHTSVIHACDRHAEWNGLPKPWKAGRK